MQSLLKDIEWLQGSPTADNLIKGTNYLKKKASFRGGWSAMDIRKRVPEANITGTDSNIIQEKKCPASTREGISIVEAVQGPCKSTGIQPLAPITLPFVLTPCCQIPPT